MTFTGGEPTLRQDLVELAEAAQWFVTRLNTNGRLLTPELCRGLFEGQPGQRPGDSVRCRRRRSQRPGGGGGLR